MCRTRFFQSPPIRRLISCHKKVLATTGPTQAEMITSLQSDSHKSAENRLPSPLTPPKRSSRIHASYSRFLLHCVIFKFRFNILFCTPRTHHPPKIPIDSDSLIQYGIIALNSRQFPSIQPRRFPRHKVFLTASSRCRRPLASCRAMSLDKGEEEEARNVDEEAIRSRDPGRAPRVHR